MLKSLLLATGVFLLLFGAQTLVVDKWIMSYRANEIPSSNSDDRTSLFRSTNYSRPTNYYDRRTNTRFFKPVYQTREWMPWSLLAAGTITVLYAYSLNRSNE